MLSLGANGPLAQLLACTTVLYYPAEVNHAEVENVQDLGSMDVSTRVLTPPNLRRNHVRDCGCGLFFRVSLKNLCSVAHLGNQCTNPGNLRVFLIPQI